MRIGITYDLKSDSDPSLPDDAQEEFDSPHTIQAIARSLEKLGHTTVLLGDNREFLAKVLAEKPDFVFNFAEGTGVSRSREARVPAVLEMLGIPFTGSDPLTMAATLDKDCAKRLVRSAGVATPQGITLTPSAGLEAAFALPFPLIVKPAWEGSSKGIRNRCLVHDREQLAKVVAELRRDQRQPLLLEEYIQGDELTVGVLGNEAPEILGIMRIVPRERTEHFVYSLEIKREYKKLVRYECPAPLPADAMERVRQSTLKSFEVLGCRDVARIDFRVRDGVPYFLEVNPLPGLNPDDSDLVILAGLAGWTYDQLIAAIVRYATERNAACGLAASDSSR